MTEVRGYRRLEWKENWCQKNHAYITRNRRQYPDLAKAPEPTDKDLNWPENMVSVNWGSGFITMTMEAFQKLPKKQQSELLKLGGMK